MHTVNVMPMVGHVYIAILTWAGSRVPWRPNWVVSPWMRLAGQPFGQFNLPSSRRWPAETEPRQGVDVVPGDACRFWPSAVGRCYLETVDSGFFRWDL